MSKRLSILYYTFPAFLDVALPLARELSQQVDLHLVLEVAPESWNSGLLDVTLKHIRAGVLPADPVLRDCFPSGVRTYWRDCASFNLVVHDGPRSVHPRTWAVSHQAARLVRTTKPDLLRLEAPSLRVLPMLWELRGLPLVLTVHDGLPHSGEGSRRDRLMRRLTFPQATHFVLHNRHDLAAFCSRYRVAPERVEVIPLGSLDLFREWITHPVAQDDRTVLFFGRLSPYKGLDILYKAAPEIARQVPGLRIVIAGKPVAGYMPPQPPALTNGGRVEVIEGHIPNSLLAQLFQQATLVVCPYVDATQSGVVLTAYAFRRPVVASRAGGLPEYVQDGTTGYLVPPADAPALAQAIIRLLKEPGTRALTSKWQHEKMDMPLPWTAIARQEVKLCSRILT